MNLIKMLQILVDTPPVEPPVIPPTKFDVGALPEDIREWAETKEGEDRFFDHIRYLRRHQGQSIKIPGEDASDERREKFKTKVLKHVPDLIPRPENDEDREQLYKVLGKPDTAENYTMPDLSSDTTVKLDMAPAEELRPIAHKHNLTDAQFQGVVRDMTALNILKAEEVQREVKDRHGQLRVAWGAAYDQNLAVVKQLALKTNAPPRLLEALNDGQIGLDTGAWLYGLTKALSGEGTELNLNSDTTTRINTIQEAKDKIQEVFSNKTHPYWVASDPGHAAAVKQVQELHKEAYPSA